MSPGLILAAFALGGAVAADVGDGASVPPAEAVNTEPPALPEMRRSPSALRVRSAPDTESAIVGLIAPNAAFLVLLSVPGQPCGEGDATQWGILAAGYACLTGTTVVIDTPRPLPDLVAFDPPTPEEYKNYLQNGLWPRDPASTEALTPYVYGKSWRHWTGATYANIAAWERGDPPLEASGGQRKFHFVGALESSRGAVLELADATVVPLADVYIYPVSRFHGVELTGSNALMPGETQAWVYTYGGASVREAPATGSRAMSVLPYQASFRVKPTSVPHWLEVPDAGGPGIPGYVSDAGVRRALPLPAPAGQSPGALWIDVDTTQQVLMLMLGEQPVFATLVSTGLTNRATPPGVYAITDKVIFADMESRADADPDEAYLVEGVPWIMHFRPRYALHAAFWHWGFGNRASHGCVNLSPLDARRIFDAISPHLPEGWSRAAATIEQPGTPIRIR